MKQTIVRLLMLLLVLCMTSTALVACGDEKEKTDTGDNTVTDAPDENYSFPATITLSDKELNIFNFDEFYNAIIFTDTEEYGDKVSEAVYDRNAYFYDRYKVDVVENKFDFTGFPPATTHLTNLRNAGDDIYDITYVSLSEQYALVSSGVLTDLNTVSTLNLDAEWWDLQLSTSYVLKDGRQYVASSALNLMPYEMTWLLFFNQNMAEVKGVPNLFEIVRNGEWTIEKLLSTVKDCGIITENAEGGYTFEAAGTATYGIALHHVTPSRMINGFDISFIQPQDKEDQPYKFACSNTDAFTKANEWLMELCTRETGMAIGSDIEDDPIGHPEGYVPVFNSNRALFLHAELKSGMTLKKIYESEIFYGMLPQPKYNTDQKNYYTTTASQLMLFAIPTMNDEAEATGTAADVLSYLSYRDLLPVYYGDYVSHRNVNDPDSLEMLNDYIMPGRRLDIGEIYGWTKSFIESYQLVIYKQQEQGGMSFGNMINSSTTRAINVEIKNFFKK